MPRGPKGEKRPADVIGNAVRVMRIATGEVEEDLSDSAIKRLIRSAKKRGYVTYDQINSVLPSEEVNSEQIEDVLAMFREMGVNFVETEETSKEGEEADEEAESESGELV